MPRVSVQLNLDTLSGRSSALAGGISHYIDVDAASCSNPSGNNNWGVLTRSDSPGASSLSRSSIPLVKLSRADIANIMNADVAVVRNLYIFLNRCRSPRSSLESMVVKQFVFKCPPKLSIGGAWRSACQLNLVSLDTVLAAAVCVMVVLRSPSPSLVLFKVH